MSTTLPPPLTISPAAALQVKALLAKREPLALGVRVGIKTRGCSGLTYTFEYADTINPFDKVIEQDGIKVLIDPKALMFLLGTEMDYNDNDIESGFSFRNPNEKGRCGCGESFHV
jgi:iron-sulfur cluster assembly protein